VIAASFLSTVSRRNNLAVLDHNRANLWMVPVILALAPLGQLDSELHEYIIAFHS
jgi:hypothetical protein